MRKTWVRNIFIFNNNDTYFIGLKDNEEKIVTKNQPVLKFQLRSKMQSQIKQTSLSTTFVRKFSKKRIIENKANEDLPMINKIEHIKDKKARIMNSKKIVYFSKDKHIK